MVVTRYDPSTSPHVMLAAALLSPRLRRNSPTIA